MLSLTVKSRERFHSLFNATIHLETPEEQNRAFSDAVIRIKDESLKERNRTWDPTDIQGLQELVKSKERNWKSLEESGSSCIFLSNKDKI